MRLETFSDEIRIIFEKNAPNGSGGSSLVYHDENQNSIVDVMLGQRSGKKHAELRYTPFEEQISIYLIGGDELYDDIQEILTKYPTASFKYTNFPSYITRYLRKHFQIQLDKILELVIESYQSGVEKGKKDKLKEIKTVLEI